jgi:hypothetical protein
MLFADDMAIFGKKHLKNCSTILIYYIAIELNGAWKLTCKKQKIWYLEKEED